MLLSFLSYNSLDGEVKGMLDLQAAYEKQYGPGNYIPSINLNYWAFRIMVGSGFAMLGIAAFLLFQMWRKKLDKPKWVLRFLPFVIALPYLANTFGWILTETGRQPWVVFGLLKTEAAVSPILTPGLVLTSLIGFTVVYGLLMVVDVFLLVKFAKAGPPARIRPETRDRRRSILEIGAQHGPSNRLVYFDRCFVHRLFCAGRF